MSTGHLRKAKEIIRKSGKKIYLRRLGDNGDSAYKSTLHMDYKEDTLHRFDSQHPSLSRADIKAEGSMDGGVCPGIGYRV